MITIQERVHGAPNPEGWIVGKLHHALKVCKGNKNTGMREGNLLSLSYGRIIEKDIGTAEGLLPESFEKYQIVNPGNIVMRLTDLQNDKRSLRQGLVKHREIITSAYDALKVDKNHDPRFWAYALLALDHAKYYYSLGGGVRQSIKFSDFSNEWIAHPDLDAQKAIADFLDRETGRIDQLMERKRRQVELLKEKRSALISHAVTCGLDPTAPMKPSGVEWLGEIPEHWVVKSACFDYEIQLGKMLQTEATSLFDQETQYLKAQHVQWESVKTKSLPSMWASKFDLAKYGVLNGDLLVCEGGDVGRAGIVNDLPNTAIIQNALHRVRSRKADLQYLMFLLEHAASQNWFEILCNRSTIAHFTGEKFGALKIPFPPLAEQQAIASFLDRETTRIDSLIEKVNLSMEKLKEFRSAIITAAVTGQIDVTTWGKRGETDRRLDTMEKEITT
ncbi:MAG: restriction endonuclease subunit S [Nitrospinota bacterium]|nr:restriction endonuclease subunit S [Nitrospinota bacterium]